ncbi:hypothetical protein [Amycolatopsis sp. NPDC003676]
MLLSSANADGTTNLAPMSSAWVLGRTAVLGFGSTGHTFANLRDRPDCVLNYPSAELWPAVERLAGLTGAPVVPAHKAGQSRPTSSRWAGSRNARSRSNAG